MKTYTVFYRNGMGAEKELSIQADSLGNTLKAAMAARPELLLHPNRIYKVTEDSNG